jgi:hypothetical protein
VNSKDLNVVLLFTVVIWFMNKIFYDLAIVVTVDVNSEYTRTMEYSSRRLLSPSIAVNIHPV